jgi:sRNA-binding carbon storage regulator CsrA
MGFCVLTRCEGERIVMTVEGKSGPVEIVISFQRFRGKSVRVAIEAPQSVKFLREELARTLATVDADSARPVVDPIGSTWWAAEVSELPEHWLNNLSLGQVSFLGRPEGVAP